MKVNKKEYAAPVAEEIQMALGGPVLTIGSGLEDGGDDEAEGDGSDQLSGEARSDWDDIWVYM